VDDALGVRGLERERDRCEDRERIAGRYAAAASKLRSKRVSVHELEHHIDEAVGRGPEIMDRHGIRMPNTPCCAPFAEKAIHDAGSRDVGRDDLDRDHVAQEDVSCLIHRAHAAPSEKALNLVDAVEESSDERRRIVEECFAVSGTDHEPGLEPQGASPTEFHGRVTREEKRRAVLGRARVRTSVPRLRPIMVSRVEAGKRIGPFGLIHRLCLVY
jgi:hypothetical protein